MANLQRSLPHPLTARNLWHWVYFTGADSAMAKAVDIAKLGITSSPGGAMSGDWKKTKVPNADFGGYSDSSSQIWCDQQKQHIRCLIHQLPPQCRALGNLMYMPTGTAGQEDMRIIENHLYRVCMKQIQTRLPKLPPERRAKLAGLIRCALSHYHAAISPGIEGGTPRSMDPKPADVGRLMAQLDQRIETRNWSREYRPMWRVVIKEVQSIDSQALVPLDLWVADYWHKIKSHVA